MWRAQIATTFVIDPFFTAIIVAGLIASMRCKVTRAPAVIGLAVLTAYVGFQEILHRRAVAVGNAYIAAHRLESAQAYAIPQPLSPFNWMVVVEQPQGYYLAYINLRLAEISQEPTKNASWLARLNASYRPVKDAQWQPVPRDGVVDADRDLVKAAWNSDCLHVIVTSHCFPPCTGRTTLQGARACGSMIYGSQLLAARCRSAMAPAAMV